MKLYDVIYKGKFFDSAYFPTPTKYDMMIEELIADGYPSSIELVETFGINLG